MITHFKDVQYRFLSNFYKVDVLYRGIVYPSCEHAYMSAKSDEEVEIDGVKYNWKDFCRNPKNTPSKVKGESRFLILSDKWESIKNLVMEECLIDKFSREPLRSMLLATGTQNIQEGNWHGDIYWGVDLRVNPNIGENHLGRLLMQIRDEIRKGNS